MTQGYNSEGRAYPDVAFIATKFKVIIAGELEILRWLTMRQPSVLSEGEAYTIYGSSCAAPVFAAMGTRSLTFI
jgi:hypothetical protein